MGVGVGMSVGRSVFVGIALWVSTKAVLTVAMAVSMISAGLTVGVDRKLLQDAIIPAARNKGINVLLEMFILQLPLMFCKETPNGSRPAPVALCRGFQGYRRARREAAVPAGGWWARQSHFAGANSKPHKLF